VSLKKKKIFFGDVRHRLGQDTIHGQAFVKLVMNVVSPTQNRKFLALLSYYIKEQEGITNRRELQGKTQTKLQDPPHNKPKNSISNKASLIPKYNAYKSSMLHKQMDSTTA